jgi:hypothetical protein
MFALGAKDNIKRKPMKTKILFAAILSVMPLASGAADAVPEEIIVTGRLPGPPLWKVSKGEHVLWIFPHLSPIPKDMIWVSDRVERVIAESQEYIGTPHIEADTSPLLLANPINWVRGYRLMKRLQRNSDGSSLEESLSPDVYARYAALRAKYFPDEDKFEDMRPLLVGGQMTGMIQEQEGLVDGGEILDQIMKFARRNRGMERTNVYVEIDLNGSFGELADRAETMMESFSREQEAACFEQQVRHMEEDLANMKSRANTWAQGYVDEFRNIPLVGEESNACVQLALGSSEQEMLVDGTIRLRQVWLDAVEKALEENTSTFAVLEINELLRPGGYLKELRERGYEIREP